MFKVIFFLMLFSCGAKLRRGESPSEKKGDGAIMPKNNSLQLTADSTKNLQGPPYIVVSYKLKKCQYAILISCDPYLDDCKPKVIQRGEGVEAEKMCEEARKKGINSSSL